MSKLLYTEFVKKMLESEDYEESRLKVMFHALSQMDAESRGWFIKCMLFGTYPQKKVEGFTVESLMEKFSYTKVQAFLVFDWLKHEPEQAKYYLFSPAQMDDGISEQTRQKMIDYLKKKGINPYKEEAPEAFEGED